MAEITHETARTELVRTLLRKVQEDQYPSVTVLDTIEGLLHPDEVPAYVVMLQKRIQDDRFPSIPMIKRLTRLLG